MKNSENELGFSECMGVMLANPCHPYIQRGYRPFVIPVLVNNIRSALHVHRLVTSAEKPAPIRETELSIKTSYPSPSGGNNWRVRKPIRAIPHAQLERLRETASVRVCSWNCSCPICSRSAIIEIELDLALGTTKKRKYIEFEKVRGGSPRLNHPEQVYRYTTHLDPLVIMWFRNGAQEQPKERESGETELPPKGVWHRCNGT